MEKKKLLQHVGSMQQLAYTRYSTVSEGRANNLRTVEVKNADMRFLVAADKCMDIASLEYKGMNLSFTAKPGLNGRNSFDTHGEEALRSITGGLFFTCGLENICAPCETDGKEYPMHGRMRTTPAEHVCADAFWQDGDYLLKISGEMREAELFGENMILRRTITSSFNSGKIRICDQIENQSCRTETMMLMYHCNFGYPFLESGCRLILPTKKVTPRDAWSMEHIEQWHVMDEPADNEQEYVFIHELAADEQGRTFAAIVNDRLGVGVRISFNRKALPYFMEWKSIASGDYVIGLEPSNSAVYGRKHHEAENTLHTLEPYGLETVEWSFTLLKDRTDINAAEQDCESLLKQKLEDVL